MTASKKGSGYAAMRWARCPKCGRFKPCGSSQWSGGDLSCIDPVRCAKRASKRKVAADRSRTP